MAERGKAGFFLRNKCHCNGTAFNWAHGKPNPMLEDSTDIFLQQVALMTTQLKPMKRISCLDYHEVSTSGDASRAVFDLRRWILQITAYLVLRLLRVFFLPSRFSVGPCVAVAQVLHGRLV